MTVEEVAEYLRIPRGSVYRLAQQGQIPCQKAGKHWRFLRPSIDLWLAARGPALQTKGGSSLRGEGLSVTPGETARRPRGGRA